MFWISKETILQHIDISFIVHFCPCKHSFTINTFCTHHISKSLVDMQPEGILQEIKFRSQWKRGTVYQFLPHFNTTQVLASSITTGFNWYCEKYSELGFLLEGLWNFEHIIDDKHNESFVEAQGILKVGMMVLCRNGQSWWGPLNPIFIFLNR